MSWFSKLKSRLTKSSDRIDESLSEIFDGTTEVIEPEQEQEEVEAVIETTPEVIEETRIEAGIEAGIEDSVRAQEKPHKKRSWLKFGRSSEPEAAGKSEKKNSSTTTKDKTIAKEASASEQRRLTLDDLVLEELEEKLIMSDLGTEMALKISAALSTEKFGKKISLHEMKTIMAREMSAVLEPVAKPLPLGKSKPQVILVVGVNGSGKTTTIGKLALQFKSAGKSVLIAACDTFRAAAVEQLAIWGERADVPVMKAELNADAASLAFDALNRATKEGYDILMVDTAGRLQNRTDLMDELGKIRRVLAKIDQAAPHNTILVLDATTGQNAIRQVEEFRKVADVSGLVMTKLDGTAKGGILVAIAHKFGIPIHAIGVGESIDDLQAFDPDEFAKALAGLN